MQSMLVVIFFYVHYPFKALAITALHSFLSLETRKNIRRFYRPAFLLLLQSVHSNYFNSFLSVYTASHDISTCCECYILKTIFPRDVSRDFQLSICVPFLFFFVIPCSISVISSKLIGRITSLSFQDPPSVVSICDPQLCG